MTVRTIKFTSIYEDGDEVENEEKVDLDDSKVVHDDEHGDSEYDPEYLEDILYPLTGSGRSGDAGYFAESVDGLEPAINKEWC